MREDVGDFVEAPSWGSAFPGGLVCDAPLGLDPGIESRSRPKKTRHGSVPCLVYVRSKDLGFQTAASAFQTEQGQAEQSNGHATFRNRGAVSRS